MNFAALPPEVTSAQMYSGPGAGPMLMAASAWDSLAVEMYSSASSFQAVIAELTAGPWRGPSSISMAAAAAPYAAWIALTANQIQQTALQARAAATAYEAAFAMIVPPHVVAANRALLAMLVATNLLGQNMPAIAAAEAEYAEMWVQDASAMFGYAAASATASTLTTFTSPTSAANPAGPAAGEVSAVLQTIASFGSNATQSFANISQLFDLVPAALQSLVTSMPLSFGASSLTSLSSSLSATTGLQEALWGVRFATLGTIPGTYLTSSLQGKNVGDMLDHFSQALASHSGLNRLGAGLGSSKSIPGNPAAIPGFSVGVGNAASIGAMSVPPNWVSAAPSIKPAAMAVPSIGGGTVSTAALAGNLLAPMAAAGVAGHAGGSALSHAVGSVSQKRRALSESERDELNRLRQENAALTEERDILKRSISLTGPSTDAPARQRHSGETDQGSQLDGTRTFGYRVI